MNDIYIIGDHIVRGVYDDFQMKCRQLLLRTEAIIYSNVCTHCECIVPRRFSFRRTPNKMNSLTFDNNVYAIKYTEYTFTEDYKCHKITH